MASDIYSMLTGGYDPRAEQMKQQQAFQQQLSQATNPQAFIAAVGSNLGGMLGQGIEKIAGVKDPREEKERLKREAIEEVKASGIDANNQTAFFRALSQAFQNRGLTAEAMQLAQASQASQVRDQELSLAQRAQSFQDALTQIPLGASAADREEMVNDAIKKFGTPTQQLELAKTLAAKEKTREAMLKRSRTVLLNNPEMSESLAKGIAEDPEIFKEYVKTMFEAQKVQNKVSFEKIGGSVEAIVTDQAGNIISRKVLGDIPKAAGTTVSVNLNNEQQGAFAQQRGKDQAGWLKGALEEGEKAEKAVRTLNDMKTKNVAGIYSGPQAQIVATTNNFLESIGLLTKAQTKKLTNSVAYDKLAKDLVMQDLDGKLGAQVSDADRKYVEARIPQLTTNPQARAELIEKMIEINQKKILYAEQMNAHANQFNNLNNFEFKSIPTPSGAAQPTVSNW